LFTLFIKQTKQTSTRDVYVLKNVLGLLSSYFIALGVVVRSHNITSLHMNTTHYGQLSTITKYKTGGTLSHFRARGEGGRNVELLVFWHLM